MSDQTPSPGPFQSGGGVSLTHIALTVSFCLNLLLIGVLATGYVRFFYWPAAVGHGSAMPGGHRGPGLLFGIGSGFFNPSTMTQFLPEKADAVRAAFNAHRPALTERRAAAMAARAAAVQYFLADDFSKPAFDAALMRVRAADAEFEAETMRAVSDSAATMTVAERRKLSDNIRRSHGRGFGFGGGGWGHGQGRGMGRGPDDPPPPSGN
jgi:uncharacterized membrane protein